MYWHLNDLTPSPPPLLTAMLVAMSKPLIVATVRRKRVCWLSDIVQCPTYYPGQEALTLDI